MLASRDTALQRNYYSETASNYDEMHLSPDDEHYVSLSYISAFLRQLSVRTVLDVGCGTGRAAVYFRQNNSEISVYGVDPVSELLDACVKKGISKDCLVRSSGLELPFKSNSFDAVLECGVLHHVREPERVVSEMVRVARKAVFLSDSNIFGQGKPATRLLKLILYKTGLWRFAKLLQTSGTGYTISQGDGVAYSYSVYFQSNLLNEWAERVFAIPVRVAGSTSVSSWSPVLNADTVLLCGIRD
jgi:ubiquinone/menaquinone biosynthesis C-methylase UbiE